MAKCVDAEERKALRRPQDQSDPAPDVVAAVLLGAREVTQLVSDYGTFVVDADDRRDVRGRAEQAGMSRHAAHRVRVLVVDLAAEALAPPLGVLFGRGALFGRPRAVFTRPRLDDVENALVHQRAEGLACDVRESGGQHDVAKIAVAELSDLLRERLSRCEPHQLVRR